MWSRCCPQFYESQIYWHKKSDPPGLDRCSELSLLWEKLCSVIVLQFVGLVGFAAGSDGKESACNVGDLGSIPCLGRSPGEGNGYLFQYSSLENRYGQRSLAGYSSWGSKELDMTEPLSFFHFLWINEYIFEYIVSPPILCISLWLLYVLSFRDLF